MLPKPKSPQINWDHPLTKGLVMDCPLLERGGRVNPPVIEIASKIPTQQGSSACFWTTDAPGAGIKFSGTTGENVAFLVTQSNALLIPTDKISFEVLISKSDWDTDTTTTRNILALAQSGGYGITVNDFGPQVGTLHHVIHANGVYNECHITSTGLANNIPHDIIGTYDGRNMILYVDGVQRASLDLGANFAIDQPANVGLMLGDNPDASTPYPQPEGSPAKCTMYLARIWAHRALTANDVKQHYTNPWQIYRSPGLLKR